MPDPTYEVEWSEDATKALLKISRGDKNAAKLIKQKVDQLADNPKPQKSINLQGAHYAGQRRLRIGDWRSTASRTAGSW